MSYFSLFLTSFASATLLPGGSEALFIYLLSEHLSPTLLLAIATLGNTLGSFINYILGKYATDFALSKGYMKEKHLIKASSVFEKYGAWSLLFSWLPIIGDPLTFVAGIVRYSWWKFLMIVGFAKFARYIFVYLGFLAIA
ncbi:MAG: YqaA family protein [Sulfurospirillum sp.]|uniref:YqaA family protein n=1 Tax=Sulfurospirillum sp. UCH001 TaxID=1581011 RepID=UPI0008356968|nr:YqaA family protein [Sulfurospirillum sp. UCH001]